LLVLLSKVCQPFVWRTSLLLLIADCWPCINVSHQCAGQAALEGSRKAARVAVFAASDALKTRTMLPLSLATIAALCAGVLKPHCRTRISQAICVACCAIAAVTQSRLCYSCWPADAELQDVPFDGGRWTVAKGLRC
jgi:hypothetical protein